MMFPSAMMTNDSTINAYASFEYPPEYAVEDPPSQGRTVSVSSPMIPSQVTSTSGVHNKIPFSQSQQQLLSYQHERPLETPWNSLQPQCAYDRNISGANIPTSPLCDEGPYRLLPAEHHELNSVATAPELVSRTEYQCWQHGCNGRSFTNLNNYRRHLIEKAGTYVKATCPTCRREFSRASARDNHCALKRCKVTLLDDNLVPYQIRLDDLYQSRRNGRQRSTIK